MMWTLIIIALAFVIWRFMQPAVDTPAAATEAPPPPPPPSEPPQAESTSGGGSGEADPFKAPGS
ncbi:MAG: hypothetical protein RIG61_12475 [Deltaproteobacteria bacterium]